MTEFGNIKWYDTAKGTGSITPEKGGDALPFAKADLQQQAEVPAKDQRYGYETQSSDNGTRRAVNLSHQMGDTQAEQASAQQG